MSTRAIILLFLLPIIGYSQQNYGEYVPNVNTILYYKLNYLGATCADESANNFTGQVDDACAFSYGRFGGGAISFGEPCNITVANDAKLRPSIFTISFWLYTYDCDLYMDQRVFSSGRVVAYYRKSGIEVGFPEGSCNGLYFAIHNNTGFYTGTLFTWGSNTPDSVWTHYVCINDGSYLYIYKDGKLDVTPQSITSGYPTYVADTNYISIGAIQSSLYYNGIIDEFIFEDRAWSAKEVRDRYNYYMSRFGSRIQSN